MTNEFSGHIARRLCRIAALEQENHRYHYALPVLPRSTINTTHSPHPKTHPSWAYNRIFLCILLLFGVLMPFAASAAEARTGLVIGNGAYRSAPLANPVNDAREMAGALREFGFDVVHKQDLNRREITEAVREYTRLL